MPFRKYKSPWWSQQDSFFWKRQVQRTCEIERGRTEGYYWSCTIGISCWISTWRKCWTECLSYSWECSWRGEGSCAPWSCGGNGSWRETTLSWGNIQTWRSWEQSWRGSAESGWDTKSRINFCWFWRIVECSTLRCFQAWRGKLHCWITNRVCWT